MDSLGTLYRKLSDELASAGSSTENPSCDLTSYVEDIKVIVDEIFPISDENISLTLSKLSVLKLFLEVILSMQHSPSSNVVFEEIFTPNFLDRILSEHKQGQDLNLTYLMCEVTAYLVFTAYEVKVGADCNNHDYGYEDLPVYLARKNLPVPVKLSLVNALHKLLKLYRSSNFAAIFSKIFAVVIWNSEMLDSTANPGFYLKICRDSLTTSAGAEIRNIMIKDFDFFVTYISNAVDGTLDFVATFLNELFPYHGDVGFETPVIITMASKILGALRKCLKLPMEYACVPTLSITILKISLWVMGNINSVLVLKDTVSDVFALLNAFTYTEKQWISVTIDEDHDLIDFLWLHLEFFWIAHKENINSDACLLLRTPPWSLFLELMLRLSFNISILNDWLISNETNFLRYFLKLLKMIRFFWSDFLDKCELMYTLPCVHEAISLLGAPTVLDACMSGIIRLKIKIERLHTANLYPYSPEPLIKLLAAVEALYEETNSD